MKFFVKVKKVTIVLDSEWDEPAIKDILEMLGYALNGVDLAGQWKSFADLLNQNVRVLKSQLEERTA